LQPPWCGGVHHDGALRHTGWGKAAGDGTEAALEGVSSRSVENCDFDGSALLVHLAQEQIETVAVAPHVGLGPDLRIDRDDKGLPVGLDAIAAEEKQRRRAGLYLAIEAIEGRAHGLFGEVLPNIDLETASPEFIGQRARVIDRIPQGCLGVGIRRIADDQRYSGFTLLRKCWMSAHRHAENQKQSNDVAGTDAGHLRVSSSSASLACSQADEQQSRRRKLR
jgi:hypothetical protein